MQRMQGYGYANNGQAATGADTSGLIQQQHDLASNELARDYGNMVQNTVAGLQGKNDQLGQAYQGIRDQRLQEGVNGIGMRMGALVNRPHSGLYNFFGANGLGGKLIGGAISGLTGGLLGGMMGGGGSSTPPPGLFSGNFLGGYGSNGFQYGSGPVFSNVGNSIGSF